MSIYSIPVEEQAPCSWALVRPDEPCSRTCNLSRTPGPGLYCDEHAAVLWAVLDQPISTLGITGLGGRKGGRKSSGEVDDSPEAQERKRRRGEALAYVAGYTGSWGLILDIRADSRFGTKYMRLSERQVEVILAGRDRDAQRRIETEVREDNYHASLYAAKDALINPNAPVRPARPRVVEDGMYRKDGVTYKVQTAVHGSGNRYAKRLDEANRTFIYAPGAIVDLSADDRMTVEDAEAFGRLYGFCCVCAATLTDEKSIARGIGPVCGKRV